ncbi:hypothetical protein MESS2_320021 [Mesorhizobium metallidurans STM 2683]|uniref:Uncharacterized protein n=1 Tax=Mesorhizobium metallidurans STM 2683 TaxID=1297569 RepID=M5EQW6_9HYPH|nr:hypothetical protein MESS2_320021 [Mesorhizobium metallidurans STM 2683]
MPHRPLVAGEWRHNALLARFAAFRPQLAVPSTGRIAYVKAMLIFDGLALGGVVANHCHVF